MLLYKRLSFITLACVLTPLLAYAEQTTRIQAFEAPPAVVTAPREPLPDDSTIFMTVINVSEEEAGSKSVAELLDSSVGLKIKKYGGLGSFSVAYIRGSSPNQVAIFLDGLPLNLAKSSLVNLGDIPLSNIEKIEVYRGFTPPEFGISAIGGAINLVTKKGSGKRIIEGSIDLGSFDTRTANTTLLYPSGEYDFTLHADVGKSEGDYPYLNDNGTSFNGADDRWVKRENNQFEYANVSARLVRNFEKFTISMFDDYYSKQNGIPGLGSFQSQNARFELTRNFLWLSLAEDIKPDSITFSGRVSHTQTTEKFIDQKGEIGLGRQENEDVSERIGASVKAIYPALFEIHYIVIAGSAFDETFNAANRLSVQEAEPERKRQNYSLALLDEINIEKWFISPSIRYELYDNDFGGDVFFGASGGGASQGSRYDYLTPKLGIGYRPLDWLTIKGNIGKYFRAPDMTELFGDRGVVVGNTDLKPEEGVNFDFGGRANIGELEPLKGFLEVTYFQTDSKNLIVFAQNSQRTSKAQNIGKATIKGIELSSAVATDSGLKLSVNYTYQDAKDKSNIPHLNGKSLPDRPRNDLFIKLEKTYGRWRGFYEASYRDQVYLDRANFKKARESPIQNTGASFLTRWHDARLTFEVKNIFDERVDDEIGYPLPGRSFFLRVDLKHNFKK